MVKKKRPYEEGDVFAVPLPKGGYAVGVLARAKWARKYCSTLGYFFGPRRSAVTTLEEIGPLRKEDALYVTIFGDLGLHNGTWPVLGRLPNWNRDHWPMPVFGHVIGLGARWQKSYYSPDDPGKILRYEESTRKEVIRLPLDALAGAGAVETTLEAILSDPPLRKLGYLRLPSRIEPSLG